MNAGEPRRTARPPPRLRVKTGCQTCLKRRKKCDETRPICGACGRLYLQCVYRSATLSIDSGNIEKADPEIAECRSEKSPLAASLIVRPEGLRTQRDWNVFNYCSTKYIQVLTSPEAPSKYRDLSFIFAVGFDKPWVMHAALAPAALHASFSSLISKEDAVLYTQSALQGLRQSLVPSRPATLRRDPCLTTSLFLAVFEEGFSTLINFLALLTSAQDFYWSTRSASLVHYQGIAQILEAQFANSDRLDINSLSILQLTLLDSTLYHMSTRLILEQDVDTIFEAFPAKTITKYIEMVESKETDLDCQPSILPVLGRTPPALFVQISRLTWLGRKLPLSQSRHYELLQQCVSELDRIQRDYSVVHTDDAISFPAIGNSSLINSELSAKLYYLATQILVTKVLDPEHVTTRSLQIQDLLEKGIALLHIYDTSLPCGQFICWPLLVLGCAASPANAVDDMQGDLAHDDLCSSQRRGLIREILIQTWNISYSGYVWRVNDALEKIWGMPDILARSAVIEHCAGRNDAFDGLNALIYKDGLGAAFLLP